MVFCVEFPVGFAVAGALLGTSHVIDMEPEHCVLHFPTAVKGEPGAFRDWDVLQPEVEGAQHFERAQAEHPSARYWGFVHYRDDDRPLACGVHRAVVVTMSDEALGGDPDRAEQVAANLTRWVRSVCDWCEVIAGLDVRPDRPGSLDHEYVQDLYISADEKTGRRRWRHSRFSVSHTIWSSSSATTAEQWEAVLAKVAQNEAPAPAYLFLRDARASHRRDEYRRATIDAATACEVALADSIRHRLATEGALAEDIDQALKGKGVIELFDLHAVVVRRTTVDRRHVLSLVAEPRNRAAHQGRTPLAEASRMSIETAAELIYAVAGEPPLMAQTLRTGSVGTSMSVLKP